MQHGALMMSRFKIYYANGDTYTGSPQYAPTYGVICILQENLTNTFHMISNHPYYAHLGDEWVGVWQNDIIDSVISGEITIQKLIVGQLISKRNFIKIFEQAKKDRAKMDIH